MLKVAVRYASTELPLAYRFGAVGVIHFVA